MRRNHIEGRIVVALMLGLSGTAFSVGTVSAQTSQADLRAYTEYAARTGRVVLPRPRIDWDRDPIPYAFDDTIPVDVETDPLDLPLNAQFTVTAIRTYRNTPTQRRFWTPVLARVESEISGMVSLINDKTVEGEALRKQLFDRASRIAKIYREELTRLAKENGKSGVATERRVSLHFVNLLTEPAAGVISYMPAGRWSLYLFMTEQRNRLDYPRPEWITIRQTEKVELGGKNWFRIRWPDGLEHKELVRITGNQPITFTPTGSR
jgi:hypothetical protein